MRNVNLNHLSIEIKSLILAVLVHVIIAEIFIFYIPLRPISNKPVFVFWGSFLDPINKAFSSKSASKAAMIQVDTHQPAGKAFYPEAGLKPTTSPIKNSDNKAFPKATFLSNQDNQKTSLIQSNKNSSISPSLNTTKIIYEPLKPRISLP